MKRLPGKRILSSILLIILVQAMHSSVQAQQLQLDKLLKDFNTYRESNYQEKLFLHLDRPSYLTGETMHFSAYLVDGSFHKPSGVSSVVYVEVLDRTNTTVLECKLSMHDGAGSGMLFLPATLNSDNYRVRAYTNWMKNYDPAFYFHQVVSIVNPFRGKEASGKPKEDEVQAHFFPEGGNLIAGVSGKVAFRVTNADDTGIDFQGVLLNQHKDTIITFAPLQFGIGHFEFTPLPEDSYTAVITDHKGQRKSFALPAAQEEGYAMKVTDTLDAQVIISLRHVRKQTTSLVGVYLVIHARNRISHAFFTPLVDGSGVVLVNRNDLLDGISHITVFDQGMKPVCERLYFKQPKNLMTLQVAPNQKYYGVRRSVKMDVTAQVGQEVTQADLSVSVYKLDSFPQSGQNIVNTLWLTSELTGNVESPEFYFDSSTETKQAIDNLMLTHGWRRFRWSALTLEQEKEFVPEKNGHILKGKIMHADGTPATKVLTYLSAPGKSINLYAYTSTEKGEVFYEMREFTDKQTVVVQTHPAADSTLRISIDSPFSTAYDSQRIKPLVLTPALKDPILERSIAMQIADIYAMDSVTETSQERGQAFYGTADAVYLLDNYTRFPVMEEVMREYVPGVFVRKRKDGFQFLVADNVHKSVFRESPLILLDGVPLFDEDEIMSTDPLLVRKLEVVQRRWYMGPLTFEGIVSYSTYTGDLNGFKLNPRALVLDYEGLQQQREVYAPVYGNRQQRESRLPDHRTMLYWNPRFTTASDGRVQLEFYTSDVPGIYKIVVEGITRNGEVGSATNVLEVKEPVN
jgi:hypothetical protein